MVPELPPPHVSDYSHDNHIADTALASTTAATAAPHQVTDISRKYDETFVPDEAATATATTAAVVANKVHSTDHPAADNSESHEDWKENIDDSPSSFVVSRSLIMIVAAILLLVAAYLAVFWFRVV
jgi:hypothetical protein